MNFFIFITLMLTLSTSITAVGNSIPIVEDEIPVIDTVATGFTYNSSINRFSISNSDGTTLNAIINEVSGIVPSRLAS